jgi:hypothetical protein
MLSFNLLYLTSRIFVILFGSLGVFCVYFSYLSPYVAANAVIFLGIAIALTWAEAPRA